MSLLALSKAAGDHLDKEESEFVSKKAAKELALNDWNSHSQRNSWSSNEDGWANDGGWANSNWNEKYSGQNNNKNSSWKNYADAKRNRSRDRKRAGSDPTSSKNFGSNKQGASSSSPKGRNKGKHGKGQQSKSSTGKGGKDLNKKLPAEDNAKGPTAKCVFITKPAPLSNSLISCEEILSRVGAESMATIIDTFNCLTNQSLSLDNISSRDMSTLITFTFLNSISALGEEDFDEDFKLITVDKEEEESSESESEGFDVTKDEAWMAHYGFVKMHGCLVPMPHLTESNLRPQINPLPYRKDAILERRIQRAIRGASYVKTLNGYGIPTGLNFEGINQEDINKYKNFVPLILNPLVKS